LYLPERPRKRHRYPSGYLARPSSDAKALSIFDTSSSRCSRLHCFCGRRDLIWSLQIGLLLPSILFSAQNSSTTGDLIGTVHDVSGAIVPGVPISARSITTNQMRRATSTEDGAYRFTALPVGDYEIRIDSPGFDPYSRPGLTVPLGREPDSLVK
jgi:hypothetical protein